MTEETVETRACVFCGATEDLTHDHVPPDNLFPSPKPSELITVPSCRKCNGGSSEDDTYFRDMLILWDATREHPEARKTADAVIKSFGRPEQRSYSRSILGGVLNVDVVTLGGLYLGKQRGLRFDPLRLSKTAGKIVKGLFYHEFRERLPEHCDAFAFCLPNEEDEHKRRSMQDMCGKLTTEPQRTIGCGVFTYWFHQMEDAPERTLWLLLFYEKVPFLGLTGAKVDIPFVE